MWQKVFDPDNAVFRPLGKLVDIVVLSVLWLALSIPLVTLGPATAALYDCCVKCVRGNEAAPYGRFFRVFRREFKTGAIAGLICLAIGLLLALGYEALRVIADANPGDAFSVAMFYAYYISLIIPAGVFCYVFPVLSRFTFGVGGLFSASFKLAVKHMPFTIVMALAAVEGVLFCLRYALPVLIVPAVVALVWSLFLERVFAPYMQNANAPASEHDHTSHSG